MHMVERRQRSVEVHREVEQRWVEVLHQWMVDVSVGRVAEGRARCRWRWPWWW